MSLKVSSMHNKRGEIDTALNKLLSISGSEGASILSSDGHMIGTKFKNKVIQSKLTDFSSEFIITALSTVSNDNFGDLKQIIILDTEKKIFMHKVQKNNSYAILFGTSKMNTGLACIKTKKLIPSFEKIIQ